MRPRIGITSGLGGEYWLPGGTSWQPYALAIEAAGGEAVHLNPETLGAEVHAIAGLQGIVFSGGLDVHLAHYPNPPEFPGESWDEVMVRHDMRPEPERDAYELPLIREALERDLPILGICRGCQVLNVALGGRLILDIETEIAGSLPHQITPPPDSHSRIHDLRVEPDTFLASLLPPDTYTLCNSRHHQAVRLDESFTARVCAVSPADGVVEAIEVPARKWCVGVQWHPEHQADHEVRELYAELFRRFAEACG